MVLCTRVVPPQLCWGPSVFCAIDIEFVGIELLVAYVFCAIDIEFVCIELLVAQAFDGVFRSCIPRSSTLDVFESNWKLVTLLLLESDCAVVKFGFGGIWLPGRPITDPFIGSGLPSEWGSSAVVLSTGEPTVLGV